MNQQRTIELKNMTCIALVVVICASQITLGWQYQDGQPARGLAVNGYEDFEAGDGDIIPTHGIWEVGIPTSGPGYAYQGESVAGTILGGNYPGNQDSRLVTPVMRLPMATGNEQVQLRFWHWFSYSTYDSGTVEISTYDVEANTWGDWKSLTTVTQVSTVWSPLHVDVTEYAGQYVQIGFLHKADRSGSRASESSGWYLDEGQIWMGTPTFLSPEDGELGWKNWYTQNGIWEVGQPTSGPSAAFNGEAVFGTVLDGHYPGHTDSRLVSPPFSLPELPGNSPSETLEMHFHHWFNYSTYDSGTVQISAFEPATAQWNDWINLASVNGTSGIWAKMRVPLSEYAGRTVRICFLHAANRSGSRASESSGWYIDEIQVPMANDDVVIYDIQLDSDPGWPTEGQWEYGIPSGHGGESHGNPDPTSGHTGQQVYGVNLNGNYTVELGDRFSLIAGPFDFSGHKDMVLEYARHLNTDEPGYVENTVEVSIDGKKNWYPVWFPEESNAIADSVWTAVRHSLGSVTDDQSTVYIRWSYTILDARSYAYSGWNIDDIKLVGTAQ